ncbi:MAG: phosphate ABC transporter permease subunit PstC [Acidobacteriota bacterium]
MATTPAALPDTRAKFIQRVRTGDPIAHTITGMAAASILAITGLLLYHLWAGSGLPRETFGWSFVTGSAWDPVAEKFGALPFIFGTVVTSIVALLVAVPVGLGAAIFLAELAPRRASDALTFMIELLAAVPSVIYGLLGIFLLVPFLQTSVVPALTATLGFLPIFQGQFLGVSIFSASMVLAIMIVPFIVSVSREVLLAVPQDQREAALALGSTRWESTWKVVVPYALRGILGSVFLALARALGETMAVTMVIGNKPQLSSSLLAPGYSIAAVIANEFAEASSQMHQQVLVELGLVLFALTVLINGAARLMIYSYKGAEK